MEQNYQVQKLSMHYQYELLFQCLEHCINSHCSQSCL